MRNKIISIIIACILSVQLLGQDRAKPGVQSRERLSRLTRIATTGNGCLDLLMKKDIRLELRMDAEQSNDLDVKIKEIQDVMAEILETAQLSLGNRNAITSKKLSELTSKRLELQSKIETQIPEILDPRQCDRLLGLFLQRDGGRAFLSPLVSARLKITKNQTRDLIDLTTKAEKLKLSISTSEAEFETLFGKIEKIQSDCDDKMQAVLSEEQKKLLVEMKGFPFEFHE